MSWFKTEVRKSNRVMKFEFDLANHMGLPNKALRGGECGRFGKMWFILELREKVLVRAVRGWKNIGCTRLRR